MGSHELRVEKGKVFGTPWIERKCIRCPSDYLCGLDCQVDDEYHMIFECKAFEHLRSEFSLLELIQGLEGLQVYCFLYGVGRRSGGGT